jgi:FkbM family methyltransferase
MTAILTRSRYGPMLCPPNDVYLSQAVIRLGSYAPDEFMTWRPYLAAGMTVLDVGANIGAHALAFSAAVGVEGRVIAVEPQRMLAYMLCGSVAMNGARNITVRQCGLGAVPGAAIVPVVDYGAPVNFGSFELMNYRDKPGELVPIETLDGWDLAALGFVKIDVEGMELAVLKGGEASIARCRPVLSVEADRESQVPALLGWLRLNGYRAWWHRPPLGPLWPGVVSINLLALPREREELPEPLGDVEVAIS